MWLISAQVQQHIGASARDTQMPNKFVHNIHTLHAITTRFRRNRARRATNSHTPPIRTHYIDNYAALSPLEVRHD